MSLAAALALSLLPVPAPAQAGVTAEQLVAPFKAICLGHLGDPAGQRAAAQAAPWNAVAKGAEQDGEITYWMGTFQISIGASGDKVCSVTSFLDEAATIDTLVAAMSPELTADGGTVKDDFAFWSIQAPSTGQSFGIGLKFAHRRGHNLGTVLVQNLG